MMRPILIAALLAAAAPIAVHAHIVQAPAAASKPVPKEQLLKPPADAVHYVVVSEAGKHGDQWRWRLPDGPHRLSLVAGAARLDHRDGPGDTLAPDGTIRALRCAA
jgi:hypothetical protein